MKLALFFLLTTVIYCEVLTADKASQTEEEMFEAPLETLVMKKSLDYEREAMEDTMGKRDVEEYSDEEESFEEPSKRSMAIGRPSLRPGKRSVAMGRLAFRPGKRSMAVGRMAFRPGKRSVAVARMGFRPGKRSLSMGRINFRPGKRSVAMGRMNFRPGKRNNAAGRIHFRPGKRAIFYQLDDY